MNTFQDYHPAAVFLYFMASVAVDILFFDPVILCISFVSYSVFYLYIKGVRTGILFIGKCLLFSLLCMLVNTLVNHRGASVLFFVGGLPVTVESAFYGMLTGLLLTDSVLVFGCYHSIMTSEKLMCLTGNFFPSCSLVFSMVLGLVPKMKRDYEKLKECQPAAGSVKEIVCASGAGMTGSVKRQAGMLSALVGLSLEDSIEMGISMRYRGYGSGKRTSIYSRKFGGRDGLLAGAVVLAVVSGIGCYVWSGAGLDVFPYIAFRCNRAGAVAYAAFAVLFNIPMAVNVREEIKWSRIVSKI